MSLSSTTTIKNQLSTALGPKAPPYFSVLKEYLSGHISRTEYDDQVKTHLDSTHLGMASFGLLDSHALTCTLCGNSPAT